MGLAFKDLKGSQFSEDLLDPVYIFTFQCWTYKWTSIKFCIDISDDDNYNTVKFKVIGDLEFRANTL